jgi:hypothetical protein
MAGLGDSGQDSGHRKIDANDPEETLAAAFLL